MCVALPLRCRYFVRLIKYFSLPLTESITIYYRLEKDVVTLASIALTEAGYFVTTLVITVWGQNAANHNWMDINRQDIVYQT